MYSAILFPVEKQLFDKQLIPWLTIRPIFYFSNSIMENKFPSTAPMQNQPPMPYVRRFTACPNLTIMGHNAIMQKHYHAEYSLSKAKKVFNPSEKHRMFRKIRCEFVCLRFLAPPPNEYLVLFSFSGQKLLIFFCIASVFMLLACVNNVGKTDKNPCCAHLQQRGNTAAMRSAGKVNNRAWFCFCFHI